MPSPSFRSITIFFSNSRAGLFNNDVGRGPEYLRDRGIIRVLRKKGITVHEVIVGSVDWALGEIVCTFELMCRISKLVRSAQDENSLPIILAGNSSFDAHNVLNMPDTMTLGSFDAMSLSFMGGLCFKALLSSVPGFGAMDLGKLVHVGLRDIDDAQRRYVEETGLSVVWGCEWPKPNFEAELSKFLDEKKAELQPTLVHVDADCLNTSIDRANRYPVPGGLLKADLVGSLQTIAAKSMPLALMSKQMLSSDE
ncbi:arginase [Fusarium beomiforme]|uniref:Arginase n=1 Tax=Fusarium beomiforme TaxID=44412 RepID=A0A9P5ABF5_9HYPO|nr:arginase [Fusarium beomiforme]